MLGDQRLSRLNRRAMLTNDSSVPILQNIEKSVERSYSNRYPSSAVSDHNSRLNLAPTGGHSTRDPNQKNANYKGRSVSGCNSDTELANGATNNAAILDSDSSSKLSVNRWRVGCRRSLSSYSSGEEDNFSSSNFPIHYDNTKDVFFEYSNSHNQKGSRQNVNETVYYEPSQLSDHSYFSAMKSSYNNLNAQNQSKPRPEKKSHRSDTANANSTLGLTRENFKKLGVKSSTFSIKDWEIAQFTSKIDVNEFRGINTEHTDGLLGLLSRRSNNSYMPVTRGSGFSGMLVIHLIAGVGLNSSHSVIKDLYCVIETDALRKARSMIRTSTECFEWDEVFEVEIMNNTCLSVLLYQWDPRFRHRLCYFGNITLDTLLSHWRMYSTNHEKLALQLEPKGLLYLEIQYLNCEETFHRSLNKNMNHRSTFGRPLKELIILEKSPILIPNIVKICVDEITFRGLEVVGIYRLSGSIKLKIQLKEMFDRDCYHINISAEAVPDIHAITSVLKDFLRELPEPLFTEAFYQMIVNAHELHKTNNTSGEKLMLNILDCLPIGNQNVLLFLIDHLLKIIAKSDINKMDLMSLANIFGPLLFHPSLEGSSKFSKSIQDPGLQSEIFQFIMRIWPNNVGLSRPSKYPHESMSRKSRKETSTATYKHRNRDIINNSPENTRNNVPVDLSSVEKSHSYSKHIRSSKSRERQSRAHKVVVSSDYYTNEPPQSGRSHSKSDRGRSDRQRSHSRGRSQHQKVPEKTKNHSRQHSQSRDRNQSQTRTHMPYS